MILKYSLRRHKQFWNVCSEGLSHLNRANIWNALQCQADEDWVSTLQVILNVLDDKVEQVTASTNQHRDEQITLQSNNHTSYRHKQSCLASCKHRQSWLASNNHMK